MIVAAWRHRPARRQAGWVVATLRLGAVAVAVLGTLSAGLIAQGWQSTVARQRDERLDRTATSRTVTIKTALGHYENALRTARSLWLASDQVDAEEFGIFARSLDLESRYPGLQGISWREVVPGAEADRYVAAVRAAEARAGQRPGFAISPPGRRPVYYVTRYSYPRGLVDNQLGADARATPSILASLEQARDTGKTVLSSQTTLGDDLRLPPDRRPAAFELILPVYDSDTPLATPAEHRRRFLGWASGRFRAGDFLDAALATVQPTTGVELHDAQAGRTSLVASHPDGFRAGGPDLRTETFAFGGRDFELRYAPRPGNPILTERSFPAPLLLGVGVALSLLLAAMLWLLAKVGALYREVERLARTDSLTGVANRRVWDDELPRELARSARSGRPVSVALLDLDHFKAYNDQHGHQAGDRLLKEAAAAWQGRLRKTDLLARYGGEEFAVLLPDCGLDQAVEIAERLRTAQPEVTCSIGVAAWDAAEDRDRLVARADRALYAAKKGGRDRCLADRPSDAAAPAHAPTASGRRT